MVLIIYTKNASNLTNRHGDMVPGGQKVWTDGRNGRAHGRRQNYIPPTSSGDEIAMYGSFIRMIVPASEDIIDRLSTFLGTYRNI